MTSPQHPKRPGPPKPSPFKELLGTTSAEELLPPVIARDANTPSDHLSSATAGLCFYCMGTSTDHSTLTCPLRELKENRDTYPIYSDIDDTFRLLKGPEVLTDMTVARLPKFLAWALPKDFQYFLLTKFIQRQLKSGEVSATEAEKALESPSLTWIAKAVNDSACYFAEGQALDLKGNVASRRRSQRGNSAKNPQPPSFEHLGLPAGALLVAKFDEHPTTEEMLAAAAKAKEVWKEEKVGGPKPPILACPGDRRELMKLVRTEASRLHARAAVQEEFKEHQRLNHLQQQQLKAATDTSLPHHGFTDEAAPQQRAADPQNQSADNVYASYGIGESCIPSPPRGAYQGVHWGDLADSCTFGDLTPSAAGAVASDPEDSGPSLRRQVGEVKLWDAEAFQRTSQDPSPRPEAKTLPQERTPTAATAGPPQSEATTARMQTEREVKALQNRETEASRQQMEAEGPEQQLASQLWSADAETRLRAILQASAPEAEAIRSTTQHPQPAYLMEPTLFAAQSGFPTPQTFSQAKEMVQAAHQRACTVFIRNLKLGFPFNAMRVVFDHFGLVRRVRTKKDRSRFMPTRTMFVEYFSPKSATALQAFLAQPRLPLVQELFVKVERSNVSLSRTVIGCGISQDAVLDSESGELELPCSFGDGGSEPSPVSSTATPQGKQADAATPQTVPKGFTEAGVGSTVLSPNYSQLEPVAGASRLWSPAGSPSASLTGMDHQKASGAVTASSPHPGRATDTRFRAVESRIKTIECMRANPLVVSSERLARYHKSMDRARNMLFDFAKYLPSTSHRHQSYSLDAAAALHMSVQERTQWTIDFEAVESVLLETLTLVPDSESEILVLSLVIALYLSMGRGSAAYGHAFQVYSTVQKHADRPISASADRTLQPCKAHSEVVNRALLIGSFFQLEETALSSDYFSRLSRPLNGPLSSRWIQLSRPECLHFRTDTVPGEDKVIHSFNTEFTSGNNILKLHLMGMLTPTTVYGPRNNDC